jgi:hypothetical protein
LRSKATLQVLFRLAFVTASCRLDRLRFDTIKNPFRFHEFVIQVALWSRFHESFLYFFQIFKELLNTVSQQKLISKPLGFLPGLNISSCRNLFTT